MAKYTYNIKGKAVDTDDKLSDADIEEIASSISAAPATATTQPATQPFQRQPSFGQQLGRTLASTADIVTGVVPAVIGGVTYAGARAMQQTPEQATATSQKAAAPFEQPFGRAFGVTETPEYKSESSRQVMDFVSKNIAKGSDWISTQTGLPKADVENMINTLSFAVGPETVVRGAKAAPAVARGVISAGEKVAEKVPFTKAGVQTKVNKTIANALDNDPNKIDQAIQLLNEGRSLFEVASIMQSPGLAALSKTSLEATPTLAATRAAQLEAERVNRLASIETGVNQLRQQVQPQTQLPQQAAETAAALERQKTLSAVPKTNQQSVGDVIAKRNAKIQEKAENEASVLYTEAYNKAGDTPIDFSGVESTARELSAGAKEAFDPNLAPLTVKTLQKYSTKVIPAQRAQVDAVGMLRREATPEIVKTPQATLQDAHELLKAINREYDSIKNATDSTAIATANNLTALKNSVLNAIEKGLPKDAFDSFTKAQENYRRTVIEPHRTGWVADFERLGSTGETKLASSKVTQKVLSTIENTDKFISTFGKDAEAVAAARNGIVDLYRNSVVRNGVINRTAHESFMRKYDRQITALDDSIPGMNLRTQFEKYGAVKAPEKTGKGAKVEIPTEVKETENILTSVKRGKLPSTTYAPGRNVTPSDIRIEQLASKVPGLKEELDILFHEKEFQKLAGIGEKGKLGINQLVKEKAPREAATGTNILLAATSVPALITKLIVEKIADKYGAKFAETNKKVISQIAEELANRPQAAITKAKTTVKAPKNALSNKQSTNALRPE